MATYDLTASSTAGVSANSIAALPDARNSTYLVEKILDVGKLVSAGLFSAITSGDIFQALEIPGGSIVVAGRRGVFFEHSETRLSIIAVRKAL